MAAHIPVINARNISSYLLSVYNDKLSQIKVIKIPMRDNSPESNYYFQQFIEGNERGLSYIHRLLYKPIRSYAHKKLSNPFEAETIIQDAFLLVWEHRDKMEDIEHTMNFIRQCIRWSCSSYFRRSTKNSLTIVALNFNEDLHFPVYDPQEDVEERDAEILKKEQLQLINDAIPYLPNDKKNFIQLFHRGFALKKIAAATNMSRHCASSELAKAFREVRRLTINVKKAAEASRNRPVISVSCFEIYLRPQEAHLLKLYYENRYHFTRIAQELNLTVFQVIKQYLHIKKKLTPLDKRKKLI